MIDQKIPCPVCQAAIPVDLHQLVQGVRFACPQCGSAIGLAPESCPVVSKAVDKLDKLKSQTPHND